eukprot:SAG11_NODE_7607_length_1122_cov_0.819159_1_plen_294_part_00
MADKLWKGAELCVISAEWVPSGDGELRAATGAKVRVVDRTSRAEWWRCQRGAEEGWVKRSCLQPRSLFADFSKEDLTHFLADLNSWPADDLRELCDDEFALFMPVGTTHEERLSEARAFLRKVIGLPASDVDDLDANPTADISNVMDARLKTLESYYQRLTSGEDHAISLDELKSFCQNNDLAHIPLNLSKDQLLLRISVCIGKILRKPPLLHPNMRVVQMQQKSSSGRNLQLSTATNCGEAVGMEKPSMQKKLYCKLCKLASCTLLAFQTSQIALAHQLSPAHLTVVTTTKC